MLGIPGEHVVDIRPFPLPPLRLQNPNRRQSFRRLSPLRGSRSGPRTRIRVHQRECRTIVSICQRLDGLPLAIELAAAWVSCFRRANSWRSSKTVWLCRAAAVSGLRRGNGACGTPSPGVTGCSALLRRRCFAGSRSSMAGAHSRPLGRFAAMAAGCLAGAPGVGREQPGPAHRRPAGDSRYTLLETVREFGIERLQRSEKPAHPSAARRVFPRACQRAEASRTR